MDKLWENWLISDDVRDTIDNCQSVIVPNSREELFDLAINYDEKIEYGEYLKKALLNQNIFINHRREK